MDQTTQPTQPKLPTLVKIIALLYMLAGVFGLLGSIAILVLGAQYGFLSPFAKYGTWGALAVFVFAAIAYLVSRGLRAQKNWARRAAIIINTLSIIVAFYNHGTIQRSMVFQLVVNAAVVMYLLLNRQVRIAFKRT